MFILIRLTQYVSGIITPIIRTDYVNNCTWSMPGCVGCSHAELEHELCALCESWYTNFHTVHTARVPFTSSFRILVLSIRTRQAHLPHRVTGSHHDPHESNARHTLSRTHLNIILPSMVRTSSKRFFEKQLHVEYAWLCWLQSCRVGT